VLGLYFQFWGLFVPGGECRKLKHGGLCEKAEAPAELPRAPVVDPKEPLTQVGMGDRKCWPLLGYVGVETPQKQLFFLMLFVILVVEKMHIPAYFPNDILIFCWENDKPLDIGVPCFQTSQNLSNANQYTHTDTHTHTQTHAARAHAHTHTYCF